ncbi:conserved hypothetical protein [gamma proteobacterium NOR5-3]|nr:conserved hypothetical protein [gamma proteobacterium NOR5-3]
MGWLLFSLDSRQSRYRLLVGAAEEAFSGGGEMSKSNSSRGTALSQGSPLAGKAFWVTIFVLFGSTIALIVVASFAPNPAPGGRDDSLDRDRRQSATGEEKIGNPEVIDVSPESMGKIIDVAAEKAALLTAKFVDLRIAEVYSPVYAAIPRYADFHYSVLGEYTELVQSAVGNKLGPDIDAKLGNSVEEYLLAGLENRQIGALREIETYFGHQFTIELSKQLEDLRMHESSGLPLNDFAQQALEGALSRVRVSMPLAGIVAGAVAANALKGSIKVVVAAFLVKATGKMAVKSGVSAAGGAATGAVAGSFLGPVGAVVGGIVGAAAVWISVDAVAINVDEYLNRSEFEAKLRGIVAEQEVVLKARINQQLQQNSETLSGQTLSDLRRAKMDE